MRSEKLEIRIPALRLLIAALVLIAQALIPRRRDVTTPAVAPAVEAGPSQPVDVPRWRRPFSPAN